MTTPTGLLEWGQAGNYNGIDDRSVITALSAGQPLGLITPPALTAQTGLTIQIGAWSALVDCGDGTRAVIGSRAAQTINETAGGASARTDILWADINPDGGSWSASFVSSAHATGVALGTVLVPINASTAAAMTLTPGAPAGLPAQGVISYQKEVDTNHSRNVQAFSTAHRFCPASGIVILAGRLTRLVFQTNGSKLLTDQAVGQSAFNCTFDMDSNQLGSPYLNRLAANSSGLRQALSAQWVGVLPAGTHTFACRVYSIAGSYDVDSDEAGVTMTVTDLGPTTATS